MASVSVSNPSALTCKRCNKKLVNGLKCKNCVNPFHSSCAKLCTNVKYLDDNTIVCCEIENDMCDFDTAFYDAIDDVANTGETINSKVFTYILRQKDIIIKELYDKIKLLNKQIELMDMDRLNQVYQSDKKSDKINSAKNISDKLIVNEALVSKKPTENSVLNVNKQSIQEPKITGKCVAAEIMKIEAELKCNEIINLVNDKPEESEKQTFSSESFSKNKSNGNWKEVSYKNRHKRQMVIGNNTDVTVKGVPRFAILHVYRVDIETTTDEFKNILKPNFPEAVVEPIVAKHPDLYKSYKVTIHENNFKTAMNPQLWPAGACVSRFFHMRKKEGPKK